MKNKKIDIYFKYKNRSIYLYSTNFVKTCKDAKKINVLNVKNDILIKKNIVNKIIRNNYASEDQKESLLKYITSLCELNLIEDHICCFFDKQ